MKKGCFLLMVAAAFVFSSWACAYEVPEDYSNAKYLYVFGQEGNPYYGADDVDHEQVLFIDIPASETGNLIIDILDPDTGGMRDLRPSPDKAWDTSVDFQVYGEADKLLASQEFSESPEFDREYFRFGPFTKQQGKKIGNMYRFKLVASGLKGEDQNLFSVRISPDSAEAFSDKISFRLLPNEGDKMYFYPEIPAGVSSIIVENYDLDPDGGSASIVDPLMERAVDVQESGSAKWAQTKINLPVSRDARRLTYVITKKTQRYANAAIRVKDDKGNLLPIYTREGKKPVAPEAVIMPKEEAACNTFLFDATSSSDPGKKKLTYLWNFGDGTTSDKPVISHTYKKAGEYEVTLTVKNDSGLECDTSTTTQSVTVNTPPKPMITALDKACTGYQVLFDASGTQDNTPEKLTYQWNFNDGTSTKGSKVTKIFDRGGIYKVNLMVDDNAGTKCSTANMEKSIKINSAPIADAGKDINLCVLMGKDFTVTLSGDGSRDPDGDQLTYKWDLGDGNEAEGRTVTHVYKNGGNYQAKLTVDDGSGLACSSSSDTVNVMLSRKPIAVAGQNVTSCVGSEVTFDGTGAKGEGPLIYRWDFGDGTTAEGARVKHAYKKGGSYQVSLTVDDGKDTSCSVSTSTLTAIVDSAPRAVLQVSPDKMVCVGDKVSFDASGSSDPDKDNLKFTWDFGDGTVMNGGSRVSHEYAKGGMYTARVTVDDGKDYPCSADMASVKINVNTPPVAAIGPNLVCCEGTSSMFDGTRSSDADGDILSYYWDFGDGNTSTQAKTVHAYSRMGNYKVVLTVDDNSGSSCSKSSNSFTAKVEAKPTPVMKIKSK